MTIRELTAKVDELCRQNPDAALAIAKRIHQQLRPGFPSPLRELHQSLVLQQLMGLTADQIEQAAGLLRAQGWDEADLQVAIEQLGQPGLREGMGFGGLHLKDMATCTEALWREGHGHPADRVREPRRRSPDAHHQAARPGTLAGVRRELTVGFDGSGTQGNSTAP